MIPSARNLPILLIGARGSGKTTVARLLAERLGWDWADADVELESRHGKSIRQIFEEEGEAGFRLKEAVLFEELLRRQRHVIAAGGGLVVQPGNRVRMTDAGLVVWLTADSDTLWRRLQADLAGAERRPDLTTGGRAEVEQVLREREPLYRACASLVVDTVGRTPHEVVEAIAAHWHANS